MTSFLGDYDRELDGDPDEPLEFEEQFILRVPREVADGRGAEIGLREMIKGKGKGMEGIEFKFLGESAFGRGGLENGAARCGVLIV
jgi:transcription initiation factor TFIID subunit 7